jgi:YHS domain-containing protein
MLREPAFLGPGACNRFRCGMTLQASAAKTAAYQGQIYYFCSQDCREKFEAAPESYVKSASVASLEKEHQHGCC